MVDQRRAGTYVAVAGRDSCRANVALGRTPWGTTTITGSTGAQVLIREPKLRLVGSGSRDPFQGVAVIRPPQVPTRDSPGRSPTIMSAVTLTALLVVSLIVAAMEHQDQAGATGNDRPAHPQTV